MEPAVEEDQLIEEFIIPEQEQNAGEYLGKEAHSWWIWTGSYPHHFAWFGYTISYLSAVLWSRSNFDPAPTSVPAAGSGSQLRLPAPAPDNNIFVAQI